MITNQTGPVDFTDVRAANLAVVLRYLRSNAPCSRADIASTTGLNKSTVSSLVADLIARRLVREVGMSEARVGRPATMLVLDGSAYAAIGLEVNADYMTVVAVGLTGERLLSWRRAFAGPSSHPGQAAASISALVKRAIAKVSKDGRHTLGLTIGVPGLVDSAGVVRLAPNLGWQDADLRSAIRKGLGNPSYPVQVDNDANLAVLAEQRYGGYAETANLIYLTGEVGIGAGIISDGRLLRGQRGYAGEFGHLQIDPAGPKCGCGRRGCLEALAGISAVVSRALSAPAPDAAEIEGDVAEVVRRAKAGDAKVLKTLAETGRYLGQGISTLANLINPDVVVLGGYFVSLSPWLVPDAEAELRDRCVAPDAGGTRIVASNLDLGAAAYGGAAQMLDTIDSGNLPRS